MTEKLLGKIRSAKLGFGGYQDAMFGLSLDFDLNGSGIGTFISGGWTGERSEYARWTEEDRSKLQSELIVKLMKILKAAKVDDVIKLKNIPVEVIIENQSLKDWRILTEVL